MSDKMDLYELLPALYRLRDAERGYPLRALLEIISKQADIIKQNIDDLWDDLFIETCDEWVIPYIGDLVGNNPLHEVAQRRRADVAKTIYYRRRKGTLPMLEELARDVTGWGAHAVAFFELLGWTQNLNHLRYQMSPNPEHIHPNAVDRVGTVNLRNLDAVDRIDGPFDVISHTVDVRPICRIKGWHNIRKIGFFLWRLNSYRMTDVTPRQSADASYGYHFSTLGNPAPLFNNEDREADETGLATEIHVPDPIRPLAFHFDLDGYRRGSASQSSYYGETSDHSIFITKDGVDVPTESIVCMDLGEWRRPPNQLTYKDAEGNSITADIVAGIDVRRGRVAFVQDEDPQESVKVNYHYGFSADMGGGPYDRRQNLACSDEDTWEVTVGQDSEADYSKLGDALGDWMAETSIEKAIITITDNGTYVEKQLGIEFSGTRSLVIQADDGKRPTLRILDAADEVTELEVTGVDSTDSVLILNGLLIEGALCIGTDSLEELRIEHCTLVPGRELDENGEPVTPDAASLIIEAPNTNLEVEVERSILGALRIPAEITSLSIEDSIIDSPTQDVRAKHFPALASGNLVPFPELSSATPKLQVSIGNEGPYEAILPEKPTGLAEARDQLQKAINSAHTSAAFTEARVIIASNHLVVLPGTDATVTIEAVEGDSTASELRLDPSLDSTQAKQVYALITGSLSPFPELTSSSPMVNVTIGTEGPHEATLASKPVTVAQARDLLQQAIRAAHTDSSFTAALVSNVDDQLVILPGTAGIAVVFSAASTDQTTLTELALEVSRPAISFSEGGEYPGPPTTLERTTVIGKVHVKELTLASEVIFTEKVVVQRRQAGCVRFSYVPAGSHTPRCYRCQPVLALMERAKELDMESPSDLPQHEKTLVYFRLKPAFTSIHYGDPGYAQLSLKCAEEICTGAEDESEMGAFSHLKQPQREANLRIRLEEYLPFGLEAGFIYVT